MQQENETPSDFLRRTDTLAVKLRCNVDDLPHHLGISRASLYGFRAGKRSITGKTWRKLEAAERTAEINQSDQAVTPGFAVRDSEVKYQFVPKQEKIDINPTLFPSLSDEMLMETSAELNQMAARIAAIQSILAPAFAPSFTFSELENRMTAAGAWPVSQEDRSLSPRVLWLKYAPPANKSIVYPNPSYPTSTNPKS